MTRPKLHVFSRKGPTVPVVSPVSRNSAGVLWVTHLLIFSYLCALHNALCSWRLRQGNVNVCVMSRKFCGKQMFWVTTRSAEAIKYSWVCFAKFIVWIFRFFFRFCSFLVLHSVFVFLNRVLWLSFWKWKHKLSQHSTESRACCCCKSWVSYWDFVFAFVLFVLLHSWCSSVLSFPQFMWEYFNILFCVFISWW